VLWLDLVFLAILQGLTEFLPISSSGHLVIAMAILERFGRQIVAPISVNVALHLGTLGATVGYFRRELRELFHKDWRTLALVVWATIPAVVVGLPLRKWAEEILENPWVAAGGLLVTGALLVLSYRFGRGAKRFTDLTWREALVIGCFQALALLPGISRSGSTIVGGILCGLSPAEAAVFAFLLAVPVMLGAGFLEALELAGQANAPLHFPQLLLGALIAGIVGWLAIAWLMRWVRTGRLLLFAYWVFAVGGGTLLWLLLEAGIVGWL